MGLFFFFFGGGGGGLNKVLQMKKKIKLAFFTVYLHVLQNTKLRIYAKMAIPSRIFLVFLSEIFMNAHYGPHNSEGFINTNVFKWPPTLGLPGNRRLREYSTSRLFHKVHRFAIILI